MAEGSVPLYFAHLLLSLHVGMRASPIRAIPAHDISASDAEAVAAQHVSQCEPVTGHAQEPKKALSACTPACWLRVSMLECSLLLFRTGKVASQERAPISMAACKAAHRLPQQQQ